MYYTIPNPKWEQCCTFFSNGLVGDTGGSLEPGDGSNGRHPKEWIMIILQYDCIMQSLIIVHIKKKEIFLFQLS